jgi:hypothetical protein
LEGLKNKDLLIEFISSHNASKFYENYVLK